MIDFYTYRTSNGRKVSIMLEECDLPYHLQIVDITAGEQDDPRFRALNANGRIPVIVDHDGLGGAAITIFESGAILMYLAEKTGRFLPADPEGRWKAIEWLMWQMGGVGPNFGQAFHFLHQFPKDTPDNALAYGRERYLGEVRRLCEVMDHRLAHSDYLAGDDYSIADIANWCWVRSYEWSGIEAGDLEHLKRWRDAIRERPASQRGIAVPSRVGNLLEDDAATQKFATNAQKMVQT